LSDILLVAGTDSLANSHDSQAVGLRLPKAVLFSKSGRSAVGAREKERGLLPDNLIEQVAALRNFLDI
jgi:hypothetical protein